MTQVSIGDVISKASEAAYGAPLVSNDFRGHLVEAIIALHIGDVWTWCGANYAAWDFEHAKDKIRLEVKQSARKQSWAPPAHGKTSTVFDIRERTGRYEGTVWIEEAGRAADIYVFAYHGGDDDNVDHRDPEQWQFYIVPTSMLPNQKTISLNPLIRLCESANIVPVKAGELKSEMARWAKS